MTPPPAPLSDSPPEPTQSPNQAAIPRRVRPAQDSPPPVSTIIPEANHEQTEEYVSPADIIIKLKQEILDYHFYSQTAFHASYNAFHIELPPAFISELRKLFDISTENLYIEIKITHTDAVLSLEILFFLNGFQLQGFNNSYSLTLDLYAIAKTYPLTEGGLDLDLYSRIPYRKTAVHNGRNIGGIYDAETGLFTVNTNTSGMFYIAYVEELIRLLVRLDSYEIIDLAGNAPTIIMDVLPIIQNDRTLLPVRFIAYIFNAEVEWDCERREVTLSHGGESLTFAIGQVVEGMDIPAQIFNDRTFVPLRFISEFFAAQVNWDESTRSIEILR